MDPLFVFGGHFYPETVFGTTSEPIFSKSVAIFDSVIVRRALGTHYSDSAAIFTLETVFGTA